MSETVEKKGLLPKLRFPEFQGTPFAADDAGTFFKAVSDRDHNKDLPVLAITQDHGAIPRDLIDYNVSVTDASLAMYKVVRDGDFIISLRSFQGGIERSSYTGLCSPAYIILRADEGVQAEFFRHYFKTKEYISQLNRELEGLRDGKMISYSQFARIPLPMPSIAEQRKIAECLQSLDELIGAEMEKLEALKRHKKGLLQQLFPAEGETTPRLRFPQFRDAGEWTSSALGDVCETSSGGTPLRSRKDYWDGSIPWVTTSLIDGNRIVIAEEFITELAVSETSAKLFPPETLVIAMYGQGKTRGRVAVLGITATTNQACAAILPNEVVSSQFLFFQIVNAYQRLRSLSNSGGQDNLSQGLIAQFEVGLPPGKEEQLAIASALDNAALISFHQEATVVYLRFHKAALMQQLFPSIDELDGISE
jgi:type I restriction enzyme S subunit